MQNRQYTKTSENSSYTIVSSLQISTEAEKARLTLPASATAILNLAGIINLMFGSRRHTFLQYHARFAKAWHKHHPALFNFFCSKLRERKAGLQLNCLSWHTCLEGSKEWQLLHMASSDFLNLRTGKELCSSPCCFHTSHRLMSQADATENITTKAKDNLFVNLSAI